MIYGIYLVRQTPTLKCNIVFEYIVVHKKVKHC